MSTHAKNRCADPQELRPRLDGVVRRAVRDVSALMDKASPEDLARLQPEDWRPWLTWAVAMQNARVLTHVGRRLAWIPSVAADPDAFAVLSGVPDGEILLALCATVRDERLTELLVRLEAGFPGHAEYLRQQSPSIWRAYIDIALDRRRRRTKQSAG